MSKRVTSLKYPSARLRSPWQGNGYFRRCWIGGKPFATLKNGRDLKSGLFAHETHALTTWPTRWSCYL